MPTLWTDSLEAHRAEVRDTIGDHAWRLVRDHGLLSVTMSQVAAEVGISRVTLYKYFPDVEAILTAWHQRQVMTHLDQLEAARDAAADPQARLRAVLKVYAQICRRRAEHGPGELADLLHQGRDLEPAHQRLVHLVAGVLQEAAEVGAVRADQPAQQLTAYCLRALTAAADLPPDANTTGLVDVVLSGLQPPSTP